MISANVIAAALKKELWSFFSNEAHKDWDIVRYINSAVRSIVLSRNFWFNKYKHTINVSSWVNEYDIPYQIETFFVKKWKDTVDYEDFEWYYLLDNTEWVVWIWENVFISEEPWEYTIFYRWFPTQINSLEDNIQIPEHFKDLVILKATVFWFLDIKNYTKAATKDSIYEWMIKDMAKRSSNPQPRKITRLHKSKSKVF